MAIIKRISDVIMDRRLEKIGDSLDFARDTVSFLLTSSLCSLFVANSTVEEFGGS